MALVYPTSVSVQVELAGVGGGWTTLADVLAQPGIRIGYGIQGTTPRDRVASTGTMVFHLRNGQSNSVATLGYYSPDHASKLTGWGVGIGIRLAIVYSGTTYYKWRGTIESIIPIPGQYRERRVMVTAVDWMDDAAKAMIRNIPTQTDQRTDQLLTTLVEGTGTAGEWEGVPRQPGATSFSTGNETLEYAFDGAEDETTPVLTEIQKIANSEAGYVFVKGDTTQGGTLVFQNRTDRGEQTTNAVSLDDDDLREMDPVSDRSHIINDVKVTAHPRKVDGSAVILFNLEYTPLIQPGRELKLTAGYRDPDQKATRVGGTSMVTPVATTDYIFNAAEDGSGTDLTTSLTVSVVFGATSADCTIKNTGTAAGYLTLFKIRGVGIYAYETVTSHWDDGYSRYLYGQNTFSLDMAYQSNPLLTESAASWVLYQNKDPFTRLNSVAFTANASDSLMTQALAREIGNRVGITETLTGVTAAAQNVSIPIFSPIGSVYIPSATAFEGGTFKPWTHHTSSVIYLARTAVSTAARLVAIDLSTPASPSTSELTHANFDDPNQGVVIGDYLYLQDGNASAVHVIDVSTPASPSYDSQFTNANIGDPDQIVGAGNWLYLSDDDGGSGSAGVKVLDISTPGSPSYDNTWTGTSTPHNLALSSDGNLLAVGDWTNKRVFLVDVSDPTAPSTHATVTEDYTDQLSLAQLLTFSPDDRLLYVTTNNSDGEQTVSVLDVSTPASPTWARQNERALIELDTTGDESTINGVCVNADGTTYLTGLSVDRDPSGSSWRGRAFKVANGTRMFPFAEYPRSSWAGNTAYMMTLVGPAPADYGAAVVLDEDGTNGLQVFQLQQTVSRSVAHYIQAVDMTITDDNYIRVSWMLQPTLAESFWLLDTAGFTELGLTTRLGWGVS